MKLFIDIFTSTLLYVSRKTAQKERCYFCFDQFFVFCHHILKQRGIKKCFGSTKKETTNGKQKCYDNNFVIFIIFLLPYKRIKIEGCTIPKKKKKRLPKNLLLRVLKTTFFESTAQYPVGLQFNVQVKVGALVQVARVKCNLQ